MIDGPLVSVLLGLGSNLGDPRSQLRRAVQSLAQWSGLELRRVSSLYRTRAWGGPDGQDDFLNAAVLADVDASWTPRRLLNRVLALEHAHDRVRTVRNGPRTLDIDLLDFGGLILQERGLVLPHPGLDRRPFVLGPAAEIAPHRYHPQRGVSLATLLEEVGDEGLLGHGDDSEWWHAVGHPSIV